MKQLIAFFVFVFSTSFLMFAQPEPCGMEAVMNLAKQANPNLAVRRNSAERQIQDYLKNSSRSWENEVITIPTVIHIIYHADEENLPDSIIYSQMEVLNEDFRRLNADTINTPDYFKPLASDLNFAWLLVTPKAIPQTA